MSSPSPRTSPSPLTLPSVTNSIFPALPSSLPPKTYVYLWTDREILDAIHSDDPIAALEPLLTAGLDLNGYLGYYGTPLFQACVNGNEALALYLISQGADPTLSRTRSPLRACSSYGRSGARLAKLLIAHGANPNAPGVLITAARYCRVDVAKVLLEHGAAASLNVLQDEDDAVYMDIDFGLGAPLHVAARAVAENGSLDEEDQVAMVKLLLEWGADLKLKNKKGMTALEVARLVEAEEVEEILVGAEGGT